MCSYKAVVLAIKLACAGEEHSASRHVYAHGECLCSKQGLGWELKKTTTLGRSHHTILRKSFSTLLEKVPCGALKQMHVHTQCF